MKGIRSFFDFYIESSVHVALSVTSLQFITMLEFERSISLEVLCFTFLGTITGYNFIKYAEIAGLQHKSLVAKIKKVQLFSFAVFCLLVYFLFKIPLQVVLLCGVFGVLTLLYVVPFLYRKNFRTLSGVKIFIVALVWAGVSVLVPLYNYPLDVDVWLTLVQRILVVLALIVPFEIRDVLLDSFELRTFPQRFGVRKTKIIGVFLVLIVLLLEGFKDQITSCSVAVLFVVSVLLIGGILVSKTKQSKYFASFWIESIPIVWGIFLFLFCHFLT